MSSAKEYIKKLASKDNARQSIRKMTILASLTMLLSACLILLPPYTPFSSTIVKSGDTDRWKTGRSNKALPIRKGTTGILITGFFRAFPAVVDDLLEQTIGHICEGFNVTDMFLYMKMDSPGSYTVAVMTKSLVQIKGHIKHFGIKEIDSTRDDLLPSPGACPIGEFPIDPLSPRAHFSSNAWTQFQDVYMAYLQLLRTEENQGKIKYAYSRLEIRMDNPTANRPYLDGNPSH
jgi:hypothetical protein